MLNLNGRIQQQMWKYALILGEMLIEVSSGDLFVKIRL